MPKPQFSAKLNVYLNKVSDLSQPNKMKPGRQTIRIESAGNDFYKSMRLFLIFGRLIGIFPVDGLEQKNQQLLNFKSRCVKSVISLIIALSLLFCIGVSVVCLFWMSNKNVKELVWATNPVIFFSMGFFGYAYMYRRQDQFRSFLQKWHNNPLSVYNQDQNLTRDSNLIAGIIFSSAILENVLQQSIQLTVFDWLKLRMNGTDPDMSPLEGYYMKNTQPNWSIFIPYNPFMSILTFIWNKCALYAWNFMDIFIIIFARALYFQFRAITKYTEDEVIDRPSAIVVTEINLCGSSEMITDSDKWLAVSKDFETLCWLLDEAKRFLSPMVFVSYAVNLFFVIVHLHMGLTPADQNKDTAATELYRTWSFLQILVRLYLMTLFASRIHESAEEFVELYRQCPADCYSLKVERVERSSRAMKLGLTGMNCFLVTKPFMLSLVSVVLTFEIVLLQTSGFSYF